MKPKEYAKSLRLLASFYEGVPEDFPVPWEQNAFNVYLSVESKAKQAAEAIRVAHILGESEKEYSGSQLYIKRKFGEVELKFVLEREAVCTRKVVATKFVPEHIIPSRIEEVVEWECHPLLSSKE